MLSTAQKYIIVALAALLAIAGLTIWYLNRETHIQDKTIAIQGVENKDMKDSIKKDAKSDAVTNDVVAAVVSNNTTIVTKAAEVRAQADDKRRVAEQVFVAQPVTPTTEKTLIDTKSQVALDLLWNQYCENYPDNNTCVQLKGQKQ